ncbi:MAG: hypothetical protein ACREIF_03150 [Chthoniobacterales bacterium]
MVSSWRNVPAQERVLDLEKRFGGNQSDKVPGAIDQQNVVVKFLRGSREDRGQHSADGIAHRDPNFILAQMFPDWIARKERETVAPTEQGTQLMPGTHPGELVAIEDGEKFDARLGKGARHLFRLRARVRGRAVTNESAEINFIRRKNCLVELCDGWRRRCGRLIDGKRGRFHKAGFISFHRGRCVTIV